MGVDASAILIERKREPNKLHNSAIQGQVCGISPSAIVGEFKSVVAPPSQAAGAQPNGLQTGQ